MGLVLFIYCLAMYGFCNIVCFGDGPFNIVSKIREWALSKGENFGKLFSCMMCLPTNVGFIASIIDWFFLDITLTPFNMLLVGTNLWWLAILGDGFFASGAVWLIHTIQEWFENNSGQQIYESDEEILED